MVFLTVVKWVVCSAVSSVVSMECVKAASLVVLSAVVRVVTTVVLWVQSDLNSAVTRAAYWAAKWAVQWGWDSTGTRT